MALNTAALTCVLHAAQAPSVQGPIDTAQPADATPAKPAPPRTVPEEVVPYESLVLAPISDELSIEVDNLIPMLGAPEYTDREHATNGLIEVGAACLPKLRDVYRNSDDLEVLLLIERIVHKSYVDHHVYSRKGFLGVGVNVYNPARGPEAPIPEGTAAIRITQVHEGSAADHGGLMVDDVVVALDDGPIVPIAEPDSVQRTVSSPTVRGFSTLIAAHRPGERLTLTVFREGRPLDLEVKLGRCPEDLAVLGRVQLVNEALVAATASFESWWDHHFRRPRKAALNSESE